MNAFVRNANEVAAILSSDPGLAVYVEGGWETNFKVRQILKIAVNSEGAMGLLDGEDYDEEKLPPLLAQNGYIEGMPVWLLTCMGYA